MGGCDVPVIVVTGTGTEIGKTVVTAALAACATAAGRSVAVLKPAQTGLAPHEPGDTAEVARLAGPVTQAELVRFPDPLAPNTAARRAGLPPLRPERVVDAAAKLAAEHDLVLVEGAGGLLVRLDDQGATIADVAGALGVPVLVVTAPVLGTLNVTELTARELRRRGLDCLGVVVGSWPDRPGLAERCNVADLPAVTALPLLGAVPQGAGALPPDAFRAAAADWLAPALGGGWDAESFARRAAGTA